MTHWEPEQVVDDRLTRLATVCGQRNALDAEMVELTGEQLDAGIGGQGYVSMAHWVSHRTGSSSGHARRVVRIATRRRALPASYAAFRAGRLSFDQMDSIARRVPSSFDEQACELALLCTPSQLDRLFAHYPWPDPTDPGAEPAKIRATTIRFDDDGDVRLRSCLPPEQGLVVDTALRAHHDSLFGQWKKDKAAAEAAGRPFNTPRPTLSDALERMADRSLHPEAVDRPLHQRTTAIVHIDVDTKHAGVHLGPALSAAVRRSLTCDATFRLLYERSGVALGIGRRSRDIPDRTRLAVEHRDGGCRVPGCTNRFLQIHHVQHWEDGGPTDTGNLIAVCSAHHRLHHLGELGIDGADADDPDGIAFTTSIGCPITACTPPILPGGRPPPVAVEPYQHPLGERLDTGYILFE